MSLAQRGFFRTLCSIQVEQIEKCKEKLFNPDASIKACFLFHHTPADCNTQPLDIGHLRPFFEVFSLYFLQSRSK